MVERVQEVIHQGLAQFFSFTTETPRQRELTKKGFLCASVPLWLSE